MKINVEIDCTPDEARTFLGLPDPKPMQAAVMQKLEQQMLDTIGNFDPAAVRNWLPYWMPFGASPEEWQKMMRRLAERAGSRSKE